MQKLFIKKRKNEKPIIKNIGTTQSNSLPNLTMRDSEEEEDELVRALNADIEAPEDHDASKVGDVPEDVRAAETPHNRLSGFQKFGRRISKIFFHKEDSMVAIHRDRKHSVDDRLLYSVATPQTCLKKLQISSPVVISSTVHFVRPNTVGASNVDLTDPKSVEILKKAQYPVPSETVDPSLVDPDTNIVTARF